MAIKIRNTRELVNPDKFRMVVLLYAMPGTGKTMWVGTCDPAQTGIAACETGLGKGVLTIADRGFDVCEPENLSDLQQFCSGKVFPDKKVLVVDSLSAMVRTFIKDAALAIPRANGESPKRKAGILELDDYGTLAEMTRKTLDLLISANPDKHIIVTATERYDKPGPNDPPGTESLIGPDLPGQMFLGSPAMFDFVFRLRTRQILRDPRDAKSRYTQRYFITQQMNGVVAKCRSNSKGIALLNEEEIFDITTGEGSFPYMVKKIVEGYARTVSNVGVPGVGGVAMAVSVGA